MKKLIPFGYLISIVLFLSSIFYFFAANWPEFARGEKLMLSVGAMLLFYIVSITSTRLLPHQIFLGKWFLVAAAISFGLSIALVGQIYNSHADSYMLFLIWFIPSFLLAIITRFAPLSFVSYVLFHLVYWFFMNPSSYTIVRSNLQEWLISAVLALLNALLFLLTLKNVITNKLLLYVSYSMTHILLIGLSFFEFYEPYSGWTNLIYLAFAAFSYIYLSYRKIDKNISIILFTMASLYVCAKIIEFPFLFGDSIGYLGLQILGSVTSIGIIVGGFILARQLAKKHSDSKIGKAIKGTLLVIVTLIGSFMFASSFGSVLYLIFDTVYASVFLSMFFITIGLGIKKVGPYIRNTLITIGFFTGLLEAFYLSMSITILFIAVSAIVILFNKAGIIRFISYTTIIGCIFNLLLDSFRLGDYIEAIFLTLAVMNAALAYFFRKDNSLKRIGTIYFYTFFYALTFLDNGLWNEILYSFIFFSITTVLLLFFARKEDLFVYRLTFLFWIALLISTYYDLMWTLVHKSISLLVIGVIFFIVTQLYDRRLGNPPNLRMPLFTQRQWRGIGLVILLQLGVLGYQIGTNEMLLKNGKEVTLALAPVDPRSMLQGDYVMLRYEIAETELHDEINSGNRVFILARKDQQGIYQREEVLTDINPTDYKLEKDEVIIAGKYNGYNEIILGIESYFVPEDTGLNLQQNAKFAKVKVSENGNALLESIY